MEKLGFCHLILFSLQPYLIQAGLHVLILHQHFKTPQTGGAIRSYYLAKALVEAGHEITVITAHNAPARREEVEGIKVHYLSVPYDNRFTFYARSWAFVKFLWLTVQRATKLGPVDLCYAISVPLTIGWAARWLRWRHGIPYIFEVGDLWPDAPIQMGFVKNYVLRQLLYNAERAAYREAKAIVALSPAIKESIDRRAPGKRVYTIPNMADCDFYRPEKKSAAIEEKFGVKGKLVISYVGAVGLANGLDYFLECVNAARKANLPVHFLLCGDGALLDRLKNNAKQLGLIDSVELGQGAWLTFVPFTDRAGVREVMNVTDAAFVCYKPVPILETGSPNKYFDGLAAGKLIIVNFGGWIRKDIESQCCGFYCDPHQPGDFVKKLTPFVDDRQLLAQYQQSARALAEKKYARTQLTTEWLRAIAAVR